MDAEAANRAASTQRRSMSWLAAVQAVRGRIGPDHGQDLLEYALLVALIVIAAIAGVTQVGNVINTVFWEAIASR